MQIRTVDGFPAELDAVSLRGAGATFYHTRAWIRSLERAYPSLCPGTVTAWSGSDLVGFLPFFRIRTGSLWRVWSLPFGTYGGPVTLIDEAREMLVDGYLRLRGNTRVHEVGMVDFTNLVQRRRGSRSQTTHVIDLTSGFDAIWEHMFEKSKRRQARKAQREGIRIRETVDQRDIDAYYRIYIERCDGWGQRTRYSKELIENLLQYNERVRLFLAELNGEVVGGHLNFYFRDMVIAWNGVTTESNQGANASTMLYAHCLRHACENGFQRYNLGASLGKESLVVYKRALGGAPYQYQVLRWRSLGGRIVSALIKALPRR